MAEGKCQVNYAAMSRGICRICHLYTHNILYIQRSSSLIVLCGINSLTHTRAKCYIFLMKNKKKTKHENLKKVGLFNPDEDKVTDPLFVDHPEFFDPCDNLQVRYELLRSHLIDKETITRVCKRFGTSRQTFYTLEKKFEQEGTAGILPKKPGPRGPRKLTIDVLTVIEKSLEVEEDMSAERMRMLVHERCGVSLHKRTVEKVCKELRVKKNSGTGGYEDVW